MYVDRIFKLLRSAGTIAHLRVRHGVPKAPTQLPRSGCCAGASCREATEQAKRARINIIIYTVDSA